MFNNELNKKCAELIEENKWTLVNGTIEKIGINIIGHFGNCIELNLILKRNGCSHFLFGGRAFTSHLGTLLKALYETLACKMQDNSVDLLNALKDAPVRLILDEDNECVGIANFISEKYLIEEEFVEWLVNKKEI